MFAAVSNKLYPQLIINNVVSYVKNIHDAKSFIDIETAEVAFKKLYVILTAYFLARYLMVSLAMSTPYMSLAPLLR